jgi:hypothetical protein
MKKMILAALLTIATAPAFAADIPAMTTDQDQATLNEQSVDEQAVDENAYSTQLDEQSMDEQSLPPPQRPGFPYRPHRPYPPQRHLYMCYSRDLLGRQYWGQDWNQRRAANESLQACRSRARLPFACRFVGCRVRY